MSFYLEKKSVFILILFDEILLSSTENNLKVVPAKSKSNHVRASRLLNVPQLDGKHRNRQNSGDKKNDPEGFSSSKDRNNTDNSYRPGEPNTNGHELNGKNEEENDSRNRKKNSKDTNDNYKKNIEVENNSPDGLVRNIEVWREGKENDQEGGQRVFDLLDADNAKKNIPYMHPATRKHTFEYFFDKVHQVCDPITELDEEGVMDVMQCRMGGSYLTEMKDLRKDGNDRSEIEEHFLRKDVKEEEKSGKKRKRFAAWSETEVGGGEVE